MLKLRWWLRPVWATVLVLLVASCGGGGSSDGGASGNEVAFSPAPIATVDAPIDGSVVKTSRTMIEGVVL